MNTQTHNVQHALLPIYIVKKSVNGNVLDQKKIHFQINSGSTYKVSYKFFMPRGFHLAQNVTPSVHCRLINGTLNVPSVQFTYVQDGGSQNTRVSSITIKFLDANTGHQIDQQNLQGRTGQRIDVIHRLSLPSGYHLLSNQKTDLVFNDQSQVLSLLLRRNSVASDPRSRASVPTHSANRPVNGSGLQAIRHGLRIHDQQLGRNLLQRIMSGNLQLLQRIISGLGSKAGYQNQSGLRMDSVHQKVFGSMQNSGHRIYLRGRKYQNRLVSISEIRDFVTCVVDNRAERGIFITTSAFSPAAQREAHRHHVKIIDGHQLAQLMIKRNVGTKVHSIYKVLDLDQQFFN